MSCGVDGEGDVASVGVPGGVGEGADGLRGVCVEDVDVAVARDECGAVVASDVEEVVGGVGESWCVAVDAGVWDFGVFEYGCLCE